MNHDILEKTNAQNVFDNKYIIVFRVSPAI